MSDTAEQKFLVIKHYISSHNIRIKDLSERAGYARPYISSVLSGKVRYNENLLNNILQALDIDYSNEVRNIELLKSYYARFESAFSFFEFTRAERILSLIPKTIKPSVVFVDSFERLDQYKNVIELYLRKAKIIIAFPNPSYEAKLAELFKNYHQHVLTSNHPSFQYFNLNELDRYADCHVFLIQAELLMYEKHYSEALTILDTLQRHFDRTSNSYGLYLSNMLLGRLKVRTQQLSEAGRILEFHQYHIKELYAENIYLNSHIIHLEYEYVISTKLYTYDLKNNSKDRLIIFYQAFIAYQEGSYYHFDTTYKHFLTFSNSPAYLENVMEVMNHSFFDPLHPDILNQFVKAIPQQLDDFLKQCIYRVYIDAYEKQRNYKSANTLLKSIS